MPSMRLRCARSAVLRAGLPVGLLAAWMALGFCGAARADRGDALEMRVLLYAGSGPVEIESGGRTATFEAVAGGVRRDADRVRDDWSVPASQRTRVAGRTVLGSLRIASDDRAAGAVEPRLVVINSVGLEDYVAGVLGGEIPASWEAEALAAQAVASRSYALYERALRSNAPWHVTATTSHQVYADSAEVNGAILTAVERTRGEVLTFAGQPILAVFHSASGGRTAAAAEVWGQSLPYLVSRDVPGEEDSPDTYWRAGLSLETFGRLLRSAGRDVGRPNSFSVLERTASGRVARIEVRGSGGRVELSGGDLRSIVGESTLRSTLFDLRPEAERIVFVGTGRGHGVGMSQWGAQAMARDGRRYPEILAAFYPGTRVEHWSRTAALRP